jgi:hypothetical protein
MADMCARTDGRLSPPTGLVVVLLVAAAARTAHAAGTDDALERTLRDVVTNQLFADAPEEFERPPWLLSEEPAGAHTKTADGTGARMSIGAASVFGTEERGDAHDYAGDGGAGTEFRLAYGRPRGWRMAVALSQVGEGLYSAVDAASVLTTRYMVGVERSWHAGRVIAVSISGGLSYSVIDIDAVGDARDISGAGGFAELRLGIPLGGHLQVGIGGRAIAWQGEDGLGNTGEELSTIVSVDVGVTF